MAPLPRIWLTGLFLQLLMLADAAGAAPDTVGVTSGQLIGVSDEGSGVTVYRGIPYAPAPVGDLRWRPPADAPAWSGVRRADAFGDVCMQILPEEGSFYFVEFYETPQPMSEDCLYLNVWAPSDPLEEPLPVMVWIHGGAFIQGSGSLPSFDATRLAQRGAVVVTLNYRLGAFGLLAHPDLTAESGSSGNYGLLDQIAALRWVRQNIASFGGDPNNVTLFGQSAGAASVNQLMTSPLAEGFFHRAILQSGSVFAFGREWQLKEAEAESIELAESLGGLSLDELREVPADTILARSQGRYLRPNVDGYVLPTDAATAFKRGLQQNVDLLVGTTADEGSPMYGSWLTAQRFRDITRGDFKADADAFLSLYPFETDEEAGKAYSRSFADELAWGARHLAILHRQRHDANVFAYRFTRVPPGRNPERYGAYHSAELVYAFDVLESVERPWEAADERLADQMASYWVNFARTGNPNGADLPEWPAFDPGTATVMELGDEVGPTSDLDPRVVEIRLRAWRAAPRDEIDFDPQRDLLSLHYDHAPDKDDGHSAVADRVLLETEFGRDWLAAHTLPVSGTYGENAATFDEDSDAVMDAAWNDVGGWIGAHGAWDEAVGAVADRWKAVLERGEDVWVKEGGQSDLTASVVERLRQELPDVDFRETVHVVQHSDWNEEQTTDPALVYVREHTDYIRIRDANAYLNSTEGIERFVDAARSHPQFGAMWRAAFDYYDPNERLDFSDTGELMYILGLGEMNIYLFREKYLAMP